MSKPAGLPTQAPLPHDCLQSRCIELLQLQPSDYLTPVHRLDRVVSGLVLFALTKKAARLLSEQFASRVVRKTYLAIVPGNPFASTTPGSIDTWTDNVAKVKGQPRAETVSHGEGKQAITKAELVGFDTVSDRSLIRLHPKTGRMHQLRVQLADRGFPILGDDLYGSTVLTSDAMMIALHAESLTFRDPKSAKWVTCWSPAGAMTNLIEPALFPPRADG